MKYKAILLVLASEDIDASIFKRILPEWRPLFPFMRQVYQSYMDINPDIKVLFVYGSSGITNEEYDIVYPDIPENYYPGMIHKTMRAFEYIENNYEYEYIIRTNLSTFWDLNKLSKRLDQLPKSNCLTGTPVNINGYSYTSGFDMVISRDIIRKIIPHSEEIVNYKVWLDMEDLALCTGIEKHTGIKWNDYNTTNKAMSLTLDEYDDRKRRADEKGIDHYRVKTRMDRSQDKIILQKLLKDIYDR